MQNLMNELSKGWRAERALSQMTLGDIIEKLKGLPFGAEIENICEPHSYRGYYSDLAFEKGDGSQTVESLLRICESCLGEEFIGYKGGEFLMDINTPLWIAEYGCCGVKIIEINEGDVLSFLTENDD